MDFKSLYYFKTVAEELNFTRAAERLNMSQPPLSYQIRELERDLGVKLFERSSRKLTLTPEGELFYRRVSQILALSSKTRSELSSLENQFSGTLHIGLVGDRTPFLAARWIAGFQEEYPLVDFQLWNGGTDEVLDRIGSSLLDAGVIASPNDPEHFFGIKVEKEPWIAVMPSNHPYIKSHPDDDTVPVSEIAGERLIIPHRSYRKSEMIKWFSAYKEPRIFCETSDYFDAVALVEQGIGIAVFPQTTYTPNAFVETRMIVDPARYVEYELVWSRSEGISPLTREFISYVKNFMESNMMHSERFRVRTKKEFQIPDDAKPL